MNYIHKIIILCITVLHEFAYCSYKTNTIDNYFSIGASQHQEKIDTITNDPDYNDTSKYDFNSIYAETKSIIGLTNHVDAVLQLSLEYGKTKDNNNRIFPATEMHLSLKLNEIFRINIGQYYNLSYYETNDIPNIYLIKSNPVSLSMNIPIKSNPDYYIHSSIKTGFISNMDITTMDSYQTNDDDYYLNLCLGIIKDTDALDYILNIRYNEVHFTDNQPNTPNKKKIYNNKSIGLSLQIMF